MRSRSMTGERLVAAFLLGLVLFNPPLMSIFTIERFVLGVPVLYFYMFAAWAGLLVLIVLGNRGRRDEPAVVDPAAVSSEPPGNRD